MSKWIIAAIGIAFLSVCRLAIIYAIKDDGKKNAFWMICAAIGLVSMLAIFLPHTWFLYKDVFELMNDGPPTLGAWMLTITVISHIAPAAWLVISFTRPPAATPTSPSKP